MIKYLSIPFVSYLLLMPYGALVGRNALGDSTIEEWFVIMQILFFGLIITSIRKMMK